MQELQTNFPVNMTLPDTKLLMFEQTSTNAHSAAFRPTLAARIALALSNPKAAASCEVAVRGKPGRSALALLPEVAAAAADVACTPGPAAAWAFLKPACVPHFAWLSFPAASRFFQQACRMAHKPVVNDGGTFS